MQEGPPPLAGRPPSFDHVLGDARLRDLKPELEQFAVNAWRTPKRIFDAHPPDQRAQFRVDLRSPSQWERLPTPGAAKAGPVPTHERLGPDDCENLQDRRKPAIQLNQEPAIMVREPDATRQPTPHDNQLMSKHRVLSLKPQLRLEWRGQDGQNETEQTDHSASLGDSITASTRIRFSVHTGDLSMTILLLEEVFRTEGLPEFTFVPAPNYNEILLDIRRAGKPVILEGQSGTGKTTCVKRILTELNDQAPTEYLTARNPVHISRIESIVRDQGPGRFVIDDFHRLAQTLHAPIADVAKIFSEVGDATLLPKLIIIGINQVGSGLIQLVPDIAKRTGIHRILPGRRQDIAALIASGSERLNINIVNSDTIYDETLGDYWLTQQLCQSICAAANVTQTAETPQQITYIVADTRQRVVERLRPAYYPAVKDFCRGRRFRPSNDPYFKLLREVGQQESSIVDLNEMANSRPEVRGSINNIKERRLEILIESKPAVALHFYYNDDTKSFAIEDPALFYFIKHLDWNQLRQDCGFREQNDDCEFEVALSFAGA